MCILRRLFILVLFDMSIGRRQIDICEHIMEQKLNKSFANSRNSRTRRLSTLGTPDIILVGNSSTIKH